MGVPATCLISRGAGCCPQAREAPIRDLARVELGAHPEGSWGARWAPGPRCRCPHGGDAGRGLAGGLPPTAEGQQKCEPAWVWEGGTRTQALPGGRGPWADLKGPTTSLSGHTKGWRPANTQVTKGLQLQRGLFQPLFPSLHLGEQSLQPRKEAGGPSTDLGGHRGVC